jgi:hypothetical protein
MGWRCNAQDITISAHAVACRGAVNVRHPLAPTLDMKSAEWEVYQLFQASQSGLISLVSTHSGEGRHYVGRPLCSAESGVIGTRHLTFCGLRRARVRVACASQSEARGPSQGASSGLGAARFGHRVVETTQDSLQYRS